MPTPHVNQALFDELTQTPYAVQQETTRWSQIIEVRNIFLSGLRDKRPVTETVNHIVELYGFNNARMVYRLLEAYADEAQRQNTANHIVGTLRRGLDVLEAEGGK